MIEWEERVRSEFSQSGNRSYHLDITIDPSWYQERPSPFWRQGSVVRALLRESLKRQGLLAYVSYDAAGFMINTGMAYLSNSIDSVAANASSTFGFNGTVSMRMQYHDQFLRFEIEDDGMGLNESLAASLFHTPIASSKTGTDLGGAGLALFTLSQSGEQFGARFGFINKGVGIGAVFWYEMPIRSLSIGTPMSQISRTLRPL